MSGGTISGNTANSSGGVYVWVGTFTMSGGAVSGNTATSYSLSASYGGGVYVGGGTFTMSGGEISGNTAIATFSASYGDEVAISGTFTISGEARPERIFLSSYTRFVTISGPLSGPVIPIDLGISSAASLTNWVGRPVLALHGSYGSGNLASLKEHFTLGKAQLTAAPYTETPITGYTIDGGGYFMAE
jgi:hypothetical protein